MNDCVMDKKEYLLDRLIDEVQASIVLAGGNKYTDEEIRKMPLEKFLRIAISNNIWVRVMFIPPKETLNEYYSGSI